MTVKNAIRRTDTKFMLASEFLQGWPPATATPVMVMTTVSAAG